MATVGSTSHLGGGSKHLPRTFNDAAEYYQIAIDPEENFDKIEITLSHLFRKPTPLLGGNTYGGALWAFFAKHNLLREEIVEIGGGLGDVMRCLLESDDARLVKRCRMIDISPRLQARQQQTLRDITGVDITFLEGDCESISNCLTGSESFVLSNGVLADLTTDRLDNSAAIDELLSSDHEIAGFARRYVSESFPFFFPTGSVRFLLELKARLPTHAVAVLAEYQGTPMNQPSWFDNHYECGIDFQLLRTFAEHIGFRARVLNIPEIIGFDDMTPLLTVDIFTMRDTMTFEVPRVADLARLPAQLPVAAYSRESFAESLRPHFDKARVSQLLTELDGHFQPISATAFDRKNPTTWTYKALMLTGRV